MRQYGGVLKGKKNKEEGKKNLWKAAKMSAERVELNCSFLMRHRRGPPGLKHKARQRQQVTGRPGGSSSLTLP